MGMFWKLWGAATLAADVAQYHKLSQIQKQGQMDAEMRALMTALYQALRNEIFNYNQQARRILAYEQAQPRLAAGAMRVLAQRFRNSSLSPEMFDALPDKEYVSTTADMIMQGDARMFNALSGSDRDAVNRMAHEALRIPDYDYFIEHHAAVQTFRQHQSEFEQHKRGSGSNMLAGCAVQYVALTAALAAIAMITTVAATLNQMLGVLAFIGSVVGAFVVWKKWQDQRSEKSQRMRMVEQIAERVDFDRFRAIEKQVGRDLAPVEQARQNAQRLVEQFFGRQIGLLTGGEVAPPDPFVAPAQAVPVVAAVAAEKTCKNCNALLRPTAKFCAKCGSVVT